MEALTKFIRFALGDFVRICRGCLCGLGGLGAAPPLRDRSRRPAPRLARKLGEEHFRPRSEVRATGILCADTTGG